MVFPWILGQVPRQGLGVSFWTKGPRELFFPRPIRRTKKQERKPQEEESKRNAERQADPDYDQDSSEDLPLSGKCARVDCQHHGELVTLLKDTDWDPTLETTSKKSAKNTLGSSAVDDKFWTESYDEEISNFLKSIT